MFPPTLIGEAPTSRKATDVNPRDTFIGPRHHPLRCFTGNSLIRLGIDGRYKFQHMDYLYGLPQAQGQNRNLVFVILKFLNSN